MANTNRSEHVRFRYGICLNDAGCSKCKSKEVQSIAARKEFVCAECGKPLRECPPPQSWWDKNGKKVIAGVAAVVVIGGGAAYMALGTGGSEAPETAVDSVKVDMPVAEPTTKEDTASVPVETQAAPAEAETQEAEPAAAAPVPAKKDGYGKVNLGYGVYEGDLKNGKPHGHGTITYTSSHKIVDSKDFVANPGDRFEGDFREGRISSIGYWYHDGDQTAIKP